MQINVQEIFQILIGTIIVSFLIDVPSQNIRRLLVNRIFIERAHHEDEDQEPVSGADPSEASDEMSDHVTSNTPEPPDAIWGSDAEEEEPKSLAKGTRTSSVESEKVESAKDAEQEEEVVEEGEEEEEEEEEEEISEAEEVKKRPETPPPPSPPPVQKKPSEDDSVPLRRRRRQLSDD